MLYSVDTKKGSLNNTHKKTAFGVPPRGKGLETLCQGVRNSEELMDVEG
jgi:hypothetical protein